MSVQIYPAARPSSFLIGVGTSRARNCSCWTPYFGGGFWGVFAYVSFQVGECSASDPPHPSTVTSSGIWGNQQQHTPGGGMFLLAVTQSESRRERPRNSTGSSRSASTSVLVLQHLQSPQQLHLSGPTPPHAVRAAHTRPPVIFSIWHPEPNRWSLRELSLQSELVLSYWKISFSSKLCTFAPLLSSLPVSLLFNQQKTPFQWVPTPQHILPRLLLPRGGWQSHPKAHLAGNSFLPHDGWFLLSWQRRMAEDGLYKDIIIPQSIFSNSKTHPKPSLSQPLSCPTAAHATAPVS